NRFDLWGKGTVVTISS
uniref:Uncharacterized protein n=1 Tax=Sarcophilus harrisii TaxID=9305 RepID=A0A7N4NJ69_SARHA